MLQISPCTIRRLQQADVHAVLEIVRSVRTEYGLAARVEDVLEDSDYALFETYRRRRTAYFVALDEGEIVGGAGIAPLANGNWLTCELQRMYLRPQKRGTGIGQMLFDECIAAAQSLGFAHCYAETISPMKTALAFYERNGFRFLDGPVGGTRHDHNDRWLMLQLSASGMGGHC
jgi:putative acetyltransferase